MRIAVCDDEKSCRNDLKKCIRTICEEQGIDGEICLFAEGIELLKELRKYDMIFLDIEMGKMDGLVVAEHIRKSDMHVPIVYVTSHSKYALRAYKVHPFAFVEKPVNTTDVEKIMNDYLRMRKEMEQKNVQLELEDGMLTINLYELLYVMVDDKRSVRLKTVTKTYIVKNNLTDIYKLLDKEMFYQCHRSCIVNLKYVQRLENNYDIILTNGEFCPLAQKKKTEFMERIAGHYLGSLKGSEL